MPYFYEFQFYLYNLLRRLHQSAADKLWEDFTFLFKLIAAGFCLLAVFCIPWILIAAWYLLLNITPLNITVCNIYFAYLIGASGGFFDYGHDFVISLIYDHYSHYLSVINFVTAFFS